MNYPYFGDRSDYAESILTNNNVRNMSDYCQRTICRVMVVFMNTKRPRNKENTLQAIIKTLNGIHAEEVNHSSAAEDELAENRNERNNRCMDLTQSIKAIS